MKNTKKEQEWINHYFIKKCCKKAIIKEREIIINKIREFTAKHEWYKYKLDRLYDVIILEDLDCYLEKLKENK